MEEAYKIFAKEYLWNTKVNKSIVKFETKEKSKR